MILKADAKANVNTLNSARRTACEPANASAPQPHVAHRVRRRTRNQTATATTKAATTAKLTGQKGDGGHPAIVSGRGAGSRHAEPGQPSIPTILRHNQSAVPGNRTPLRCGHFCAHPILGIRWVKLSPAEWCTTREKHYPINYPKESDFDSNPLSMT